MFVDGEDKTQFLEIAGDTTSLTITLPYNVIQFNSDEIVFKVQTKEHVSKPYNIMISISPTTGGGSYIVSTNDQGQDIVIL
ncbi:MAG: hypothetical protein MJ195_01645 [Mycoplasmoidaceae bacterium]|nr:hypothetical protein [Mycoplasmoidaceae bacterium]